MSDPSTNAPHPVGIRRGDDGQIEIEWSDGEVRRHTARGLRDACPCATCRERRAAPAEPALLPVLTAEETQPLTVTSMQPVGQYAYSIEFSVRWQQPAASTPVPPPASGPCPVRSPAAQAATSLSLPELPVFRGPSIGSKHRAEQDCHPWPLPAEALPYPLCR